jgi:hypothetical protein
MVGWFREKRLCLCGQFGYPSNFIIREDICLIQAVGRELRDYRTFRPGLEPVERVGRERVLVARFQLDCADRLISPNVHRSGCLRCSPGSLPPLSRKIQGNKRNGDDSVGKVIWGSA